MTVLISNNAGSLLALGITNSDLSLTVVSGDGSKFPDTASGGYFYLTLVEGTKIEIVKVTSRVGDVFTIQRGIDGTSAQSFSIVARVEQRWNKAQIEDKIQDHATPKIFSIPNNTGILSIVFDIARVDSNYAVKFSFECDDLNPIFLMGMIQNKTVNGFDILMNAPTDSANYKLNYTIGNAL